MRAIKSRGDKEGLFARSTRGTRSTRGKSIKESDRLLADGSIWVGIIGQLERFKGKAYPGRI